MRRGRECRKLLGRTEAAGAAAGPTLRRDVKQAFAAALRLPQDHVKVKLAKHDGAAAAATNALGPAGVSTVGMELEVEVFTSNYQDAKDLVWAVKRMQLKHTAAMKRTVLAGLAPAAQGEQGELALAARVVTKLRRQREGQLRQRRWSRAHQKAWHAVTPESLDAFGAGGTWLRLPQSAANAGGAVTALRAEGCGIPTDMRAATAVARVPAAPTPVPVPTPAPTPVEQRQPQLSAPFDGGSTQQAAISSVAGMSGDAIAAAVGAVSESAAADADPYGSTGVVASPTPVPRQSSVTARFRAALATLAASLAAGAGLKGIQGQDIVVAAFGALVSVAFVLCFTCICAAGPKAKAGAGGTEDDDELRPLVLRAAAKKGKGAPKQPSKTDAGQGLASGGGGGGGGGAGGGSGVAGGRGQKGSDDWVDAQISGCAGGTSPLATRSPGTPPPHVGRTASRGAKRVSRVSQSGQQPPKIQVGGPPKHVERGGGESEDDNMWYMIEEPNNRPQQAGVGDGAARRGGLSDIYSSPVRGARDGPGSIGSHSSPSNKSPTGSTPPPEVVEALPTVYKAPAPPRWGEPAAGSSASAVPSGPSAATARRSGMLAEWVSHHHSHHPSQHPSHQAVSA